MTDPDWLESCVDAALRDSADAIARLRRNEPGAWGHIAGQAVLACRGHLGRPLTEAERRQVWATTWAKLHASSS